MKHKGIGLIAVLALVGLSLGIGYVTLNSTSANVTPLPAPHAEVIKADDPSAPSEPVKLIFIHHSTGGNWLADSNTEQYYGGLGRALMENNYFVSATNYGWGPDMIGSNTDIGYWWDWFRGANSSTYVTALYNENGQNICNPTADPPYECFGNWPRLATEPPGENEIIMFKGCFPNAHMGGDPNADPPTGDNPLRGQSAWIWDDVSGTEIPNPNHTVENAKGIYNDILQYFATRQDKLFVVITGPPLASDDMYFPTDAAHAANYRAFNEWLVNDWLPSNNYTYTNVAVFNYYNVLTSNNGDPETNDAGLESGNHHRWWNNAIQHVSPTDYDFSAYTMWQDSHPTTAGQQKATAEFVELLNVFYNRWKGEETSCTPVTAVEISGPTRGYTDTLYTFNAVITPVHATSPTYIWTPEPDLGQSTHTAQYTWAMTGTQHITFTVENCEGTGSASATYTMTIMPQSAESHFIYLPLLLHTYTPEAPTCDVPLTGVSIEGPTTGYTNTIYAFSASPIPANATMPIAYTWSPTPESGQGTANAAYTWNTAGSQTLYVTVSNCGGGSNTAQAHHTITIQGASTGSDLIRPSDLTYLGAFRLPGGDTPPQTFAYGGNAMTFSPDGDAGKGSLFIMGHDRQPWGDLPNGGQVAEISIPTPINSDTIDNLNTAEFIQNFSNVAEGYFTNLEELPRTGMTYLNHPDTGPKIHLSWGQHHQPDTPTPSYAWFAPTLSTPNLQGVWFIGEQDWYSLNGYMFEIPASWADVHTEGRYLGTGRQMDGGWGGMGPSLFAYRPWQSDGSPIVSGTHLVETTLLLYKDTQDNEDVVQGANTLTGHQHPDEWEGGAWLTTPSGKSAVLFVGNKGTGEKYWYGYRNPAGPEYPCVNTEAAASFIACRLADGSPCPPPDMVECDGHTSAKGWWCAHFTPRFIFYDPADLAQVAAGTMKPWEPQPYDYLDVGAYIFDNPAGVDLAMLGEGIQRRYLFGAATYDRANGRLYVLELFADGVKPVVHVWHVS